MFFADEGCGSQADEDEERPSTRRAVNNPLDEPTAHHPVGVRLRAAVLAAKASAAATRWLRRGGGTTLPGHVAQFIDPDVLHKLTADLPRGTILVTGTNGKTTTAGMIVAAMEQDGMHVMSNVSGANLLVGLTAAAVRAASARGAVAADIAVFEIDEWWLEQAVVATRPRCVVVLNLLRDQLDRAGELNTLATRVGQALGRLDPTAHVVANIDDPLVLAQCEGRPGLTSIGIDDAAVSLPALPHVADARACPRCDHPLRFRRIVLGHCGDYVCESCGFMRPAPTISASHVGLKSLDSAHIELSDGQGIEVNVGGVYNIYNAVAAYAVVRDVGLDGQTASRGLAAFQPRFGRQERFSLHGQRMQLLLAKNPVGFDEVLRATDELAAAHVYVIGINDNIADGRDVSWLWDVDFERLAESARRPTIIATGHRAHDLAVRLKYAGVPQKRTLLVPDVAEALAKAADLSADRAHHGSGDHGSGEEVMVVATYTAMLELRAVAQHRGTMKPYWDTGAAS